MQEIIDVLTGIMPWWGYAAIAGAVLLAVLVLLVLGMRRRRFRRRIRSFLDAPGATDPFDYFDREELLRHTRLIEGLADQEGAEIVSRLGMDRLWTERLQQSERPADFRRVLRFAPATGLFSCFLVALRNEKLSPKLQSYLEEHSDFLVLRQLALSGRGEDFDGAAARRFFADRLDEIREMTGDPEWPSRYFAVKILLYDDEDRSRRAAWDAFEDPHPLVRRTVASELVTQDNDRLYQALRDRFLHDPVFEVRKAARDQLARQFPDRYELSIEELQPEEAVHVVELLDPDSEDDQSAAVKLLSGDDMELRLAAARALEKSGRLKRLLLEADLGDRPDFERSYDLLHRAVEVNVTGFLSAVRDSQEAASLLMAARLLRAGGAPDLISELSERVFRRMSPESSGYQEIHGAVVDCIRERGDNRAFESLAAEITRRGRASGDAANDGAADSRDTALLETALAGVPAGQDRLFAAPLIRALEDASFPARDALRAAILRLDTSRVLAETLRIIKTDRRDYAHRVRVDALKLLGELELPYALQEILEHLPILPLEEAREFAAQLAKQQPKAIEAKTRFLLDSVDGSIRASLIAALPATGKKTFLNDIKKALGDADPDVRIAATWALAEYQETRALGQAGEMLRDPLERVRLNVARAIGQAGGKSALTSLRDVLLDENEVDGVKKAAIEGLSAARSTAATDILVDVLERDDELRLEVLGGLARANDSSCVKQLIERFKDGSPALRSSITEVFKRMGEYGEEAVREVLAEDIPSLRPFLNDILEATGYVESRIRMLKHRDPKIRRSAAEFLSGVGSAPAFRGIVLAARDPDEQVRVQVTKALEHLATPEGEEILRSLQQDPERRIRKYTHWAMERLEAKKL